MDYSYSQTSSHTVAPSSEDAKTWAWHAWTPLVVLPLVVLLCAPRWWPSWVLMWSLAAAVLAGCKFMGKLVARRPGRGAAGLCAVPPTLRSQCDRFVHA